MHSIHRGFVTVADKKPSSGDRTLSAAALAVVDSFRYSADDDHVEAFRVGKLAAVPSSHYPKSRAHPFALEAGMRKRVRLGVGPGHGGLRKYRWTAVP